MSDLQRVIGPLQEAADAGETSVLASIVRTEGSTYRGVGARVLIRADGSTCGLLSGGCLESDLVAHANEIRATETPRLVTYDTRSGDDVVWGLALGCNGLVQVLLEPLNPTRARGLAKVFADVFQGGSSATLATVIQSVGGAPAVGTRCCVDERGQVVSWGEWGDGLLLESVVSTAINGIANLRRGITRMYTPDGHPVNDSLGDTSANDPSSESGDDVSDDTCGSSRVHVTFESLAAPLQLVVCGTGPDAVPVVALAAQLGWDVVVVDHRSAEFTRPENFPQARVVTCADAEQLGAVVSPTVRTAAIVMSHHYPRDVAYLGVLLRSPAQYVGILGPQRRTARCLDDLAERGIVIDESALDKLHGPIGLDLGGDGPEAIAVSIIAEVLAVSTGRSAGHLRDRRAPIHSDLLHAEPLHGDQADRAQSDVPHDASRDVQEPVVIAA